MNIYGRDLLIPFITPKRDFQLLLRKVQSNEIKQFILGNTLFTEQYQFGYKKNSISDNWHAYRTAFNWEFILIYVYCQRCLLSMEQTFT